MPSFDSFSVIFARDDLVQPYSEQEISFLQRRKGGGGGGHASSSGGGRSSSSGGTSSSSSGGKSSSGTSSSSSSSSSKGSGFVPSSVTGGRSVYGSSSAYGIPNKYSINSGSFSGRLAGGGTRNNVYGSPYYGSGYTSGYASRGFLAGGAVGGLGFPFIYWPLIYGGAYNGYYGNNDYNNGDRPGGNMTQYTLSPPSLVSNTTGNQFALYGDANSVQTVFESIVNDCGVSSTLAQNFTINPNQAVQYYRGSSFALLLNGYNNSQPLVTGDVSGNTTSDDFQQNAPNVTSVQGVDYAYFACLNSTTGNNMPLLSNGAIGFAISQNNLALLLPIVLITFLINTFS